MTDNNTWLLTADVARCYGWSVAYVRKLAYQHRWRRIRVGQEVAYNTDDVDTYYQRTHPEIISAFEGISNQ